MIAFFEVERYDFTEDPSTVWVNAQLVTTIEDEGAYRVLSLIGGERLPVTDGIDVIWMRMHTAMQVGAAPVGSE